MRTVKTASLEVVLVLERMHFTASMSSTILSRGKGVEGRERRRRRRGRRKRRGGFMVV